MKARLLTVFVLVLGLALLLAWGVAAQGPEPPVPPRYDGPSRPPPGWDSDKPFPYGANPGEGVSGQGVGAAAVGTPGLAFRYVTTFGETAVAYFDDTDHLNRPTGLFIDGSDNLYVADEYGHRMLRYDTTDVEDPLSIGTAGYRTHSDYSFSYPKDVAVDPNGYMWVVDEHRVTQYDGGGNFVQVFPDWDDCVWCTGDDNQHFDLPVGIAFDSEGRLYVSDHYNHRVQVYTITVTGSVVYSTTIGETGVPGSDNSHFNHPQRMVVDGSDQLYVADTNNHRIQRCAYAAGWTCATFHGGSQGSGLNQLSWATGLGIDGSGNIYIAEIGNSRVKKCPPGGSGGDDCPTFGSGFDWPVDVAVDSGSNVYVSNYNDFSVKKFNSSGVFQEVFAGTSGVPYLTDNGHFNTPYGVAVDSELNLYVATRWGYRLLKLGASGSALWAIGTPGAWGSDNAHFGDYWDGPNDVAVDARDNVYVSDTGNNRIQIFNSSGVYSDTLGSFGTGDYEFDSPRGAAVDSNGNLYVADSGNHRIQIYDSSFNYLGPLGSFGSGTYQFDWPAGVAVDSSSNIYVADARNNRVQIFNSSRLYVDTLGVTDEWGDDFAHFSEPRDVAVDAQGRIYVADIYNQRVQVFDSSGAYLTTIGGAWGSGSGQLRQSAGVAVDSAGNVYVADEINGRVQKFAPGVPGWEQVNINGFGDVDNWGVVALEVFNGQLYAGTAADSTGADLWRAASPWAPVMTNGFGETNNGGINDLIEFGGQLYAGTWNEADGGQVWRTGNGSTWDQVVSAGFGDTTNSEIVRLAVFSSTLYVTTFSYTDTHGTEIWRSSTGDIGDWQQVVSDGFGDSRNQGAGAMEVFGTHLYVGTFNSHTGAEVWRSGTGNSGDWTKVNTAGFGEGADNGGVISLAVFNGALYAGTTNCSAGGQLWRTSNGTVWSKVVDAGFGDINNCSIDSLIVFEGNLYAATYNHPWNDSQTGIEVWRTEDGTNWAQINPDGFGDNNTVASNWGNAVTVFKNRLYIGVWNRASSGKIWMLDTTQPVYLPIILKNE